jgi:hypothetical protein
MKHLKSLKWYLRNILDEKKVPSLTIDEWEESTTWESFDTFSSMNIYCIDKEAISESFQIPDGLSEIVERDSSDHHELLQEVKETQKQVSDHMMSNMDSGELAPASSNISTNSIDFFSTHSEFSNVHLTHVPLVDNVEDIRLIHDSKENNKYNTRNDVKDTLDGKVRKDANSTRKDAKGTIDKQMIIENNVFKNYDHYNYESLVFEGEEIETQNNAVDHTIYVFVDQQVDCCEDEIIFYADDDNGFDWHEDEEVIDIFNTTEIWNTPPLEYKNDNSSCIFININMPKTHAAFQQALSELSECKHKVNEVSRDQSKKEIPKFWIIQKIAVWGDTKIMVDLCIQKLVAWREMKWEIILTSLFII